MDPVSVFNALYDTKCLKFDHQSVTGENIREAPYFIDLTSLPLHPKLFNAVVAQVVDRFLTTRALIATTSQLRRQTSVRTAMKEACEKAAASADKCIKGNSKESSLYSGKQISPIESDADSQLEEDEEIETNSETDSEWEKVCDNIKPILCGTSGSAAALAASIAYKAQLPYLPDGVMTDSALSWIRQQQQQQSNGDSDSSDKASSPGDKRVRVILIENAISSGKNIVDSVRALEKQNLKVEFVICIVDHEESGAQYLFEQEGICVVTLYNMSAILRIIETTGRITSEQFISTRQWISNNRYEPIGSEVCGKC